ncbi:hypothetical protein D2Q93_15490 [Alicyclobacillaceae bacterium I2511]|nr:hypothetical protein D2Q93_15490 [Alicyclobacillaceae bacterium I2511]
MIFAFGFGPPWTSLLMLVATSVLSYGVYRLFSRKSPPGRTNRVQLRRYYYVQRQRAREMAIRYDLSDEEIERKIDEEIGPPKT